MDVKKLKLANDLLGASDWNFMHKSDDITFESKMIDNSGYICIKCSSLINTDAKSAHDYIWNLIGSKDKLSIVDDTLTDFNILLEKEGYRKIYQANKLPWPLAPRDLVMDEYKIDNGIVMYTSPYMVVNEACVRSDLTISYHGFIPINDTSCQVVRIVHLNPNGYIPCAIVNMFVEKAATFIKLLKVNFS